MKQREFTGRHFIMAFAGIFGVIFSVNMFLAYSAVRTFPGLVVQSSYAASQNFDERRDAQEALGWTMKAYARDGQVILSITDAAGYPVRVAGLNAILGSATHVRDDMEPDFKFDGVSYVAPVELRRGNWNIRVVALAEDGTEFVQRVILHVKS